MPSYLIIFPSHLIPNHQDLQRLTGLGARQGPVPVPVSLTGMGQGTGQDHGEVQGSNPSTTMTPVGSFIDPMRNVTGSTTLSALELGPGSGVNQAQGFGVGSGIGPGTGTESGQKQGYTDKELSVQSLGTFVKSLTTLILDIILQTLPYSTPSNPFRPISIIRLQINSVQLSYPTPLYSTPLHSTHCYSYFPLQPLNPIQCNAIHSVEPLGQKSLSPRSKKLNPDTVTATATATATDVAAAEEVARRRNSARLRRSEDRYHSVYLYVIRVS